MRILVQNAGMFIAPRHMSNNQAHMNERILEIALALDFVFYLYVVAPV